MSKGYDEAFRIQPEQVGRYEKEAMDEFGKILNKRKHAHYFKDVSHLKEVDVYRVLDLFGVTDQALGHAIKKLLLAGGRGAKGFQQDIQEAVDTINRKLQMIGEDEAK